jgi:hypothetical protein
MTPPSLENDDGKQLSENDNNGDEMIDGHNEVKTKLDGGKYIKMKTWCEDAAIYIQQLRDCKDKLLDVTKKKEALSVERDGLKDRLKRKVYDMNHTQEQLVISQRECERLKGRNKEFITKCEQLETKNNELKVAREKDLVLVNELQLQSKDLRNNTETLEERLEIELEKYNNLLRQNSNNIKQIEILTEKNKVLENDIRSKEIALKKSQSNEKELTNVLIERRGIETMLSSNFDKLLKSNRINVDAISPKVHALMRQKANIGLILQQWSDDLLTAMKDLEEKFSEESILKIVEMNVNECKKHYQRIIDAMELEHVNKQKNDEKIMQNLKQELSKINKECLENSVELSTLSDEKIALQKSLTEYKTKYNSLVKQQEIARETHMTMKTLYENRIGSLLEDTMFEELLRAQKIKYGELDKQHITRQNTIESENDGKIANLSARIAGKTDNMSVSI